MNFLLHRHLSRRELPSLGAAAGVGAMLPDLWRLVDRRLRATAHGPLPATGDAIHDALVAGVEHHLEADLWFHKLPAFHEGEALTSTVLRDARLHAPRLLLFAHIAWELCLDGALLRRQGLEAVLSSLRAEEGLGSGEPALRVAGRYRSDATAAPGRRARATDEESSTPFPERMALVFARLCAGGWIARYEHGPGLATLIDGIRRSVGLPALEGAELRRLGVALSELLLAADAGLDAILDGRAAHVAGVAAGVIHLAESSPTITAH